MTDRPKSILGQARIQGFRDGMGQASILNYDDAYERGFLDGTLAKRMDRQISSFALGFACGLCVATIGLFVL